MYGTQIVSLRLEYIDLSNNFDIRILLEGVGDMEWFDLVPAVHAWPRHMLTINHKNTKFYWISKANISSADDGGVNGRSRTIYFDGFRILDMFDVLAKCQQHTLRVFTVNLNAP